MPIFPLLRNKRRLVAALAAIAAVLACLPDYVSAYTVSGPSETPTLLLGDRVIVHRAAYELKLPYSTLRLARWGTPRRGDLVAFLVPNRNTRGLKRVVGVAGDTLEMRENRLIVNGRALESSTLDRREFEIIPAAHRLGTVVAAEADYRVTYTPGLSPLRNFGPETVPAECVFLLGDHRDNSNDSRTFGPIGRDLIEGKVVRILPAGRP